MKRILMLVLVSSLIIGLGTGCTKKIEQENIEEGIVGNQKMQAVICEISETELLVETLDSESFDKLRVSITDFTLDFTPEVGQTIDLTISPQVGMSYPAFTNPVEIKLVK